MRFVAFVMAFFLAPVSAGANDNSERTALERRRAVVKEYEKQFLTSPMVVCHPEASVAFPGAGLFGGPSPLWVGGVDVGIVGSCRALGGGRLGIDFGIGFGLDNHLSFGPSAFVAMFSFVSDHWALGAGVVSYFDFTAHGFESGRLGFGPLAKVVLGWGVAVSYQFGVMVRLRAEEDLNTMVTTVDPLADPHSRWGVFVKVEFTFGRASPHH